MAKIKEFINDKDLSVDKQSKGEDVLRLQKMLERFGYLRPGSYEDAAYDTRTERAVRKYQRFMGLKTDGVAGPKTKTELSKPRCIHPDSPGGSAVGAFTAVGAKYNTKMLTYAFENDPADLSASAAKAEIRAQFDRWQAVSQLTFSEVTTTQNPHFRIAWKAGDHQDGCAFDGVGNVLAHAFYPPPTGGAHAGQMHFDEDETYSLDGANGTYKLGAVALHEIGHLIGLNHSNVEGAVMWPSYDSNKTELHQDDINGARTLYGVGFTQTATVTDTLSATDTTDTWWLENVAAEGVELTLDCNEASDYDLYVKFGSENPTTESFDYRSWNVGDEALLIPDNPAGRMNILVARFEGEGEYTLTARYTLAS